MSKTLAKVIIGAMDLLALIILSLLQYFTFYGSGYTINENKKKEYLVVITKYLLFGVIVIWVGFIIVDFITKYERRIVMHLKFIPFGLFSVSTCLLIPFIWDTGSISSSLQYLTYGIAAVLLSIIVHDCQIKKMKKMDNDDDVDVNTMPNMLVPQ